MLSLNCNQVEEFEEREINGLSPERELDEQVVTNSELSLKADDENKCEMNMVRLTKNFSSCSVSSSSSSCCETAMGLNQHSEPVNIAANLDICNEG